MDDIQIVFEAPQEGQTRKKRARLVTSCDHCRLKKIKCTQSRNSSKCEACGIARVPCRFRDREQYFAERGRLMSRNSPPSSDRSGPMRGTESQISLSILEPHRDRLSQSPSEDSNSSSPIVPSRQPHMSSYTWPPPEPHTYSDSVGSRSGSISPEQLWHAPGLDSSPSASPASSLSYETDIPLYGSPSDMSHNNQPSFILPLFDPQWPDRPHPTLMMHFIQTYFDHYGQSFPCLAYDETIRQFLDQSLSPLIASGIAALAAWYSDLPEVVRRGAADVSGAYCAHAKALVSRGQQVYSIEAIHGLVLLAWAEYKRARMPDFCSHVKKAKHIAEHLGLANGSLLQMATNEYERNILQSTWGVLRQLVTTVETWSA